MSTLCRMLYGICGMLLVAGCSFQVGPAYPERDGKLFLEKQSCPHTIVSAVINRDKLEHNQVVEFSKSKSSDVRFLVASNPNIQPDEIDLFINDADDFTRSGTAYNTSLTADQMRKLFHDPSHTVCCSLARNPAVPTEMLLRLHKERNPGLLWFAMNPNCPDILKDEIRNKGDDLAKRWLTIMEGREPGEQTNAPYSEPAARSPKG